MIVVTFCILYKERLRFTWALCVYIRQDPLSYMFSFIIIIMFLKNFENKYKIINAAALLFYYYCESHINDSNNLKI